SRQLVDMANDGGAARVRVSQPARRAAARTRRVVREVRAAVRGALVDSGGSHPVSRRGEGASRRARTGRSDAVRVHVPAAVSARGGVEGARSVDVTADTK